MLLPANAARRKRGVERNSRKRVDASNREVAFVVSTVSTKSTTHHVAKEGAHKLAKVCTMAFSSIEAVNFAMASAKKREVASVLFCTSMSVQVPNHLTMLFPSGLFARKGTARPRC